jgi:hypothetical protein
MSATIDNELFRYYFAADHIDSILQEENFYHRVIRFKHEAEKKRQRHLQLNPSLVDDEQDTDSDRENKYFH